MAEKQTYTLDEVHVVSEHMLREMNRIVTAELLLVLPAKPWPKPTRRQRLRFAVLRFRGRVLGSIHDRFFSEYCDYDY